MSIALSFARRLDEPKGSLIRTLPTTDTRYAPDIYALRRAAERAYEAWRMADSHTEAVLYHEMRAADARLQVAVVDEQRRLGMQRDSAECGDAKAELLRRIGYGAEVGAR